MSEPIYIHYGSDHFDPKRFIKVRNPHGDFMPKPMPGTGLWGSRADDSSGGAYYGWERWCRDNQFNLDRLKRSFCFALPEASILTISKEDDLNPLPKLHPWSPKGLGWMETIRPGELPTAEQIQEFYLPKWCYLDFEELAEEYDAIEMFHSAAFRSSLNTWDCDCILVLRPDRIREVE